MVFSQSLCKIQIPYHRPTRHCSIGSLPTSPRSSHTSLQLVLQHLQAHCPPCCSLNMMNSFIPQDLCLHFSLYRELLIPYTEHLLLCSSHVPSDPSGFGLNFTSSESPHDFLSRQVSLSHLAHTSLCPIIIPC